MAGEYVSISGTHDSVLKESGASSLTLAQLSHGRSLNESYRDTARGFNFLNIKDEDGIVMDANIHNIDPDCNFVQGKYDSRCLTEMQFTENYARQGDSYNPGIYLGNPGSYIIDFAFINDEQVPCAFSIVYDPERPAEWIAAITRDTTASPKKQPAFTLRHNTIMSQEMTLTQEEMLERDATIQLNKGRRIDKKQVAKKFNDLLTEAHSKEVKTLLSNLIKPNGQVNLEQFASIKKDPRITKKVIPGEEKLQKMMGMDEQTYLDYKENELAFFRVLGAKNYALYRQGQHHLLDTMGDLHINEYLAYQKKERALLNILSEAGDKEEYIHYKLNEAQFLKDANLPSINQFRKETTHYKKHISEKNNETYQKYLVVQEKTKGDSFYQDYRHELRLQLGLEQYSTQCQQEMTLLKDMIPDDYVTQYINDVDWLRKTVGSENYDALLADEDLKKSIDLEQYQAYKQNDSVFRSLLGETKFNNFRKQERIFAQKLSLKDYKKHLDYELHLHVTLGGERYNLLKDQDNQLVQMLSPDAYVTNKVTEVSLAQNGFELKLYQLNELNLFSDLGKEQYISYKEKENEWIAKLGLSDYKNYLNQEVKLYQTMSAEEYRTHKKSEMELLIKLGPERYKITQEWRLKAAADHLPLETIDEFQKGLEDKKTYESNFELLIASNKDHSPEKINSEIQLINEIGARNYSKLLDNRHLIYLAGYYNSLPNKPESKPDLWKKIEESSHKLEEKYKKDYRIEQELKKLDVFFTETGVDTKSSILDIIKRNPKSTLLLPIAAAVGFVLGPIAGGLLALLWGIHVIRKETGRFKEIHACQNKHNDTESKQTTTKKTEQPTLQETSLLKKTHFSPIEKKAQESSSKSSNQSPPGEKNENQIRNMH